VTTNGGKAGLDGMNGEASEGSLRNWVSFLCGSGGVEWIFFLGTARRISREEVRADNIFLVSVRGRRLGS
jgi:hypothetical protein